MKNDLRNGMRKRKRERDRRIGFER